LFNDIDEILLKLYYLNEKATKKCHELADIVKKHTNFLKVGTYLSEPRGAAGYHIKEMHCNVP